MELTSAQAAKLLAKLQQEHDRISNQEEQAKTFLVSVGEDVESARPAYDYAAAAADLQALEEKIRRVKHAINLFNTSTVVPGFGMTVDELLVYLPQLSRRENKLRQMAETLPKARQTGYSRSSIVEYLYANYDPETVRRDLDAVTDELARAQLALDEVNHSATLRVDVEG